jgi:hypothetical protein
MLARKIRVGVYVDASVIVCCKTLSHADAIDGKIELVRKRDQALQHAIVHGRRIGD